MIQWICGELEANYVGERSKLSPPHQRRYQLRLLRAAVREVRAIAPPSDARPPVIDPPPEVISETHFEPFEHAATFRQARVDEAHVTNLRGSGSFFSGALFDVRVSAVELSYPAEKSGRAYGRMTGTIVACLVMPAEPPPERVPASALIQDVLPPAPKGELHVPVEDDTSEQPAPVAEAIPEAQMPPRLLPGLAISALVCVALALTRGALPAALWGLFTLPTLVARRMLHGVLPDSRGMDIVGGALVLMQLGCTSLVLKTQWSAGCAELPVLPLLGVVATLFPAGLLPSPVALLCNAACLGAILFGWCT